MLVESNRKLPFIKKLKLYILAHLIDYVQKHEKLIKQIEKIRGLYSYPRKMLGRKIPDFDINNDTDVLVFAAHPDDDILGVGTVLYRHRLKGNNVKVAFITNGTGRGGESWNVNVSESIRKFETRYKETIQSLSLINIPKENIFFLGFPDGGTQRYLKNMSLDIEWLIREMKPARIYVHCIEGGHRDHDMTSFVVKSVCHKIGYSSIFEWTEYNPKQPLGTNDVKFLNQSPKEDVIKIDISEEERLLKRKMLACHQSQDVEQFFLQGEAIRHANISQVEMELYSHSQFSKEKISSIVNNFNKSVMTYKKDKIRFQVVD